MMDAHDAICSVMRGWDGPSEIPLKMSPDDRWFFSDYLFRGKGEKKVFEKTVVDNYKLFLSKHNHELGQFIQQLKEFDRYIIAENCPDLAWAFVSNPFTPEENALRAIQVVSEAYKQGKVSSHLVNKLVYYNYRSYAVVVFLDSFDVAQAMLRRADSKLSSELLNYIWDKHGSLRYVTRKIVKFTNASPAMLDYAVDNLKNKFLLKCFSKLIHHQFCSQRTFDKAWNRVKYFSSCRSDVVHSLFFTSDIALELLQKGKALELLSLLESGRPKFVAVLGEKVVLDYESVLKLSY